MPGKHPSRILPPDDSPPDGEPTDTIHVPVNGPGYREPPAMSDRKLLRLIYAECEALKETLAAMHTSLALMKQRLGLVERVVFGTAGIVLASFIAGVVALVWHATGK